MKKQILLSLLILVGVGCMTSDVKQIAPYCEDTVVLGYGNDSILKINMKYSPMQVYDFVWMDNNGVRVMYQRSDSSLIIPDSLMAIKAVVKQNFQYRNMYDSVKHLLDSITYKQNYIHQ